MKIKSAVFNEFFLEASYRWLNDPLILNLVDAHPVKRWEQKVWFNNLNYRPDIIVKGIQCDDVPVGVFGLKNINYVERLKSPLTSRRF